MMHKKKKNTYQLNKIDQKSFLLDVKKKLVLNKKKKRRRKTKIKAEFNYIKPTL